VDENTYVLWKLGWLIAGLYIGNRKGRRLSGLIWGLFGPLGVVILLLLPSLKPSEPQPAA